MKVFEPYIKTGENRSCRDPVKQPVPSLCRGQSHRLTLFRRVFLRRS